MAQPKTPITENVSIYALDHPDFCTYNQLFTSKKDFLLMANPVIRGCPRIAIIWKEVLLEPLNLGYISWNSMIRLMVAVYQHDTNDHPCMHKEKVHFFLNMCLLLSRTVHCPPFPGGDDSKTPFYAATIAIIPAPYAYFENSFFKRIDVMMKRRSFQLIRKEPHTTMKDEDIIAHGHWAYDIMKELQILPPALADPWNPVSPYIPPIPLR